MTREEELRAIREAVELGRVTRGPAVPSIEQPREFEERARRVVVPYLDAGDNARLGTSYQTPKARRDDGT